MSFNMGGTGPSQTVTTGNFTFKSTPQTTASAGFMFGANTGVAATGGFSFGKTPTSGTGFQTQMLPAAPASATFGAATTTVTDVTFGSRPAPETTVNTSVPPPTGAAGLIFGSSTGTPGFTLGGVTSTGTSGLTFGGVTTSGPSGFTFTGSAAAAPFPSGAVKATTAAAAAPSVTVAATGAGGSREFVLGTASTSVTSSIPPTAVVSTKPASAPFSFGTVTSTTAPPSVGFMFGAPTTTTAGGGSQDTAAKTSTAVTTGFSLVIPSTSATTSTAGGGLLVGTAAKTSTAVTTAFTLGIPTTSTLVTTPVTGLTTTTLTTAAPVAGTVSSSMNFRQLEEAINKWTLELEEQEKVFLNQATQVNAWDRLLISNGEKIIQLNDAVDRVKLDQQRLDHELDFIRSQQRELEELLLPLEKAVESIPPADAEREHTYQLCENIDSQLKRMAEDLKEIIEHLNAANRNQDSNDPIVQIGRILNAHMDSLYWIDQNTELLQRKLEEVTKLHDVQKRDQERAFHLAYD